MRLLQNLLAPLSRPEQAHLLRALSDLESGSPRQWLLLEIAAALGSAQHSRRTRLLARLAGWLGIAPLLPVLNSLQQVGLDIYRDQARMQGQILRQGFDDAALLLACLSALMAGFDLLPASSQFAAWLLLLLGGAIKLWRARRHYPPAPTTAVTGEEVLPGAEAALGLHGLLMSKDIATRQASELLAELVRDPQAGLPPLVAALPELTPPAPSQRELRRATLAGWLLPIVPALWLNGWNWGWLLSICWVLSLAWLLHRNRKFLLLIAGISALTWLLARLAHLL